MNDPESGQPGIPPEYFSPDTSGLTATVKAEAGSHTIDFHLTSDGPTGAGQAGEP